MEVSQEFIDYLDKHQDGVELYQKYNAINIQQGMHGTTASTHNFGGKLQYKSTSMKYWGQHTYTYPNFVARFGEMEGVSTISLIDAIPARNYHFKSDTWRSKVSGFIKS